MIYYCPLCGRRFEIKDDATLNEIQELRLMYAHRAYWHRTCAKMFRGTHGMEVDGSSDVGKLVLMAPIQAETDRRYGKVSRPK